jgi:hypothetical protein
VQGRWIAPLLLFAACKSDPPDIARPLPLDERLGAGQARAGLITRSEELLTGPTAKGRIGDYKLYNSKIAVVIGRPGFARGYQPYGGVIVDADRVRDPGEPGQSSFGEVISSFDLSVMRADRIDVESDGRDGGPAVIVLRGDLGMYPVLKVIVSTFITVVDKPIEAELRYILEPDADHIRIEHSLRNTSDEDLELALPLATMVFGDGAQSFSPGFGFAKPEPGASTEYYGAISPSVGYLFGMADVPISYVIVSSGHVYASFGDSLVLRAREKKTFANLVVVGPGDLSELQALWRSATGQAAAPVIRGRVTSEDGTPIAAARVHAVVAEPRDAEREYESMTRTTADGSFSLALPAGEHVLTVATDAQLVSAPKRVSLSEGGLEGVELRVPAAGRLRYRLTDMQSRPLPAKVTIVAGDASVLPERYGELDRPQGTLRIENGIRGEGTIDLPAGTFRVFASRGSEYEMVEHTVTIEAGKEASFEASLSRSVDTTGWISTDTHIHAQLSPDSPDLYPFKVSSLVVEGLEMPISTEHEAIGDFNPAIRALGLEPWIRGVIGTEVTTSGYGHFNAYPLVPDPEKPGNGRIDWVDKAPSETFALVRTNPGAPFLQVNHPRNTGDDGYFTVMGFDRTNFSSSKPDRFSTAFDGIEVANGCNAGRIEEREMLDWFSFLNKGQRKVALGSTDNHRAGRGGLGYPKSFVRMGTDDPTTASLEEMKAAFFAGKVTVSCGPFIELRSGASEIGDTIGLEGDLLRLDLRASAPSWMDLDQLEIIVNGEVKKIVALPESTSSERFRGTVTASTTPGADAWVILRARGDRRHGVWAFGAPAWAFTNPIFVDGDGDGRWAQADRN